MLKTNIKIQSLPRGVKASLGFFFASVITSGIAYITTPIYTRMLAAEEYGLTSVFFTWQNLFGVVAMFCLSYGVFNNGMIDYSDKRDEYSFSMLILSNVITLCFSAVIILAYPVIKNVLNLDWPFIVLMCVSFLFQPAYNFWTSRQRYEMKYKFSVIWSIVCAFLSPLSAILCIGIFPRYKIYGRIFGAQVILIIVYAGFYFYLGQKSRFKIFTKYWKAALSFNLPLIPHYLSTYLLGSSDKIMIAYLINGTATAYYSVAHSVAALAYIVWSAVNSSLIPYTYEKCKTKDYKSISNVVMPILFLFAGVSLVVILLAPEVVAIMATPDYMEAIYVIPPIVGGVFFQVLYFIFANIVYYYKMPQYVMYASVTATLLNLILNYFFISRFGYIAAGYTTIFCYFIQATIDYFAMKKVVKEEVYNMKVISILSICIIVIALISNLIYEHAIIRYFIVIALIALCVISRRKIFDIFFVVKSK